MRKFALVMAVLLGANGHVLAEPNTYLGFGHTTCGSWTDVRATKRSPAMQFWALGFVSSWNVLGNTGNDALKGLDANALWAWLDNHCRSQPLEPFFTAVVTLTLELAGRAH